MRTICRVRREMAQETHGQDDVGEPAQLGEDDREEGGSALAAHDDADQGEEGQRDHDGS